MNTVPRSPSHRGVLFGCLVSCPQRGADPPIPGDHSVLSSLTHHPSLASTTVLGHMDKGNISAPFPDLALSISFIPVLGMVRTGFFLREGDLRTHHSYLHQLVTFRKAPLNWTLAALSPGTPRLRMFNRPSIPPLTAIQCTPVSLLPSQFLSVCVIVLTTQKNGGQTK